MKKEHNHSHEHNHGILPVILYITGLIIFIGTLFIKPGNMQNILFTISMIISGYHVLSDGFLSTIKNTRENKRFTPNTHLLMGLAAIGAMAIGDFKEGALLIMIFAGAHFLEDYVEDKSRREITNLLNLNPTEGRLIKPDGSIELVATDTLKIGDKLQVLVGDQVPTDGIIIEGSAALDEASITGESIPKEKTKGDPVFGSTINDNGTFIMEITKNPEDTIFAKILNMVDNSQSNLSKTATKIKRFEPIYVTGVLIAFPLFIIFGNYIMRWGWNEALYRGMVFLTVTSPCALAASDVPATLSAISNLAKRGVLFKGGSYLSNLAEINAVAFDKTGTLTTGHPIVTNVDFKENLTEEDKAHYINIIVAMEKQSNHPLANAILDHFTPTETLNLEVENVIGTGLVTNINNQEFRIGKPSSFLDKSPKIQQIKAQHSKEGKTVVYFGTENEVYALISMMDVPQHNAQSVIKYLNESDIQTIMITGDAKITGEAVANQIGIKQVKAEVHPEDKAHIIKELQETFGTVTMLGDGINDAPALVNADIGVAMGEGTDVAIDVADAVLMQNNLDQFAYAHKTSKKLKQIVWQNIYFSMGVVVVMVILNIMGTMNLPLGVILHEGSTIVVILNGLRMLRETK